MQICKYAKGVPESVPLLFGRGLPLHRSLSLWERSGEGCHTALHTSYGVRVPSPSLPHRGRDYCEGCYTALHTSYGVRVPSPSLPHRGRDYCEGCHTALHTSYAVRVPSPSLPHRGRDYCEGCHIIRLRRKIKKLKHANMQKWAYNRHA